MGIAVLGHFDGCAYDVIALQLELTYFLIGQRLIRHTGGTIWQIHIVAISIALLIYTVVATRH